MSKKNWGMGGTYRQTYRDKNTGEIKQSAIWSIHYYADGRLHRESSGSANEAVARKLLKQRIGDATQGKSISLSVQRTRFEDLARILIDDYLANERGSVRRAKEALEHLRLFFGDAKATEITTDRVTSYVAHRKDEGAANATINKELAALRRAFNLALDAKKISSSPRIKKLQENNARKGFFERQQFEAVIYHLPQHLRPIVETAYITGWRIASEILTRQKQHLDLDAGWLRIDPNEAKNKEGRFFPIGAIPRLRDVLAAQADRTRELELATSQVIPWLFHRAGKPIRDFRHSWKTACHKAGLVGRIPHDFRRTAVRNLERAGVSRSAAMAMVGHKTESIYRRYAIVDSAVLNEAGAKLAALQEFQTQTSGRVVPLKAHQGSA